MIGKFWEGLTSQARRLEGALISPLFVSWPHCRFHLIYQITPCGRLTALTLLCGRWKERGECTGEIIIKSIYDGGMGPGVWTSVAPNAPPRPTPQWGPLGPCPASVAFESWPWNDSISPLDTENHSSLKVSIFLSLYKKTIKIPLSITKLPEIIGVLASHLNLCIKHNFFAR